MQVFQNTMPLAAVNMIDGMCILPDFVKCNNFRITHKGYPNEHSSSVFPEISHESLVSVW